MKKLFLCITSILIILSLTACGSQGTDSHSDKSETSSILQSDSENTEAQKHLLKIQVKNISCLLLRNRKHKRSRRIYCFSDRRRSI